MLFNTVSTSSIGGVKFITSILSVQKNIVALVLLWTDLSIEEWLRKAQFLSLALERQDISPRHGGSDMWSVTQSEITCASEGRPL